MRDLSVIEIDEDNSLHLLELRDREFAGVRYAGRWHICPSPLCGCADIDFLCAQLPPEGTGNDAKPSEGSPVLEFSLDVRQKRFSRAKNAEARMLGKELTRELAPEDWKGLLQLLHTLKSEQIREADLDSLEAEFPERTNDGEMVGYVEIFPLGLNLSFLLDGENFIADDMYCVKPGCHCGQTLLTFISVQPDKGLPQRTLPIVRYYHRSRDSEVLEKGSPGRPSPGELVQALEEAHPNLSLELIHRNKQLSRLFLRAQERAGNAKQAVIRAEAKVARNAPCPCGSGKKYKKCCG